jgi:FtsP/CotA-like multicopper oxidase with cupredoxin domain
MKEVKLQILDELNLTQENDIGFIEVKPVDHRYAQNAEVTQSLSFDKIQVFEAKYYKKNNKCTKPKLTGFALPIIKIKRGQIADFYIKNCTKQSFNIHPHGLNDNSFVDGASAEVRFGPGTPFDPYFHYKFKVTNNSANIWLHMHPMFGTSPYVYGGAATFLIIEDKYSDKLNPYFENTNNIHLILQNSDFNDQGVLDNKNLYKGQWRGDYNVVNGQITINWNDNNNKYTQLLTHNVFKNNLVMISFLHGGSTFRMNYVGLKDKHGNILSFYLVQVDGGYRYPVKVNRLAIAAGERYKILIDLKDVKDSYLELFYYNFDLTENNGIVLENGCLKNPVGNKLEPANCGILNKPKKFKKLSFLRLYNKSTNIVDINKVIDIIHSIVLKPCYLNKKIPETNYLKYLNPDYYYNLPTNFCAPMRQMMFWGINGKTSINSATEYFNGQNRIFFDMWNSKEFKLWKKYKNTPKRNKYLPSCRFKIFEDLPFMNYQRILNDKLEVIIGDEMKTIIFPHTPKLLSIEGFKNLVNAAFKKVKFSSLQNTLDKYLSYDWIENRYEVPYVSSKTPKQQYRCPAGVNTILIINKNKLDKEIILQGNWSLLNFFGKPLGARMVPNKDPNYKMIPEPAGGSVSGNPEPLVNGKLTLKIKPNDVFQGYVDGFLNDAFLNFSVKKDSTETWTYNNLDNQGTHPLHFHMTQGYWNNNNTKIESNCVKCLCPKIKPYQYNYAKDIYPVPPQQSLSFLLKFPNHSSECEGKDVKLKGYKKNLGYMYHCHYITHHDMNMMGQFFVYEKDRVGKTNVDDLIRKIKVL